MVLALIIAWFSLWVGAGHLTKPLIDVSNTVKQVAEGNFKVNIKRRDTTKCEYEYINEVDELAKNVNLRNTPELTFIIDNSIEYGVTMSKKIDDILGNSEE